jgi:hypothetical protein
MTPLSLSAWRPSWNEQVLTRIIRERGATLTPTLSLSEGEGVISMPSPPEGERDRVRGSEGRGTRIRE